MPYTILKYLRLSAEDIDIDGFDKYESNSIVNQRAYLDEFIDRIPEFKGCEIVEELDDGRTGTNFDRPGVQKAIEMAQAGKVHCIIVKDLSRWGRNYLEVGDYLEQKFPAWDVRFISINDMYDSAALNGATGGINIAFRNLIYEMYSQDLSEKVKSGRLAAAKSGKNCAPYPFYGYLRDPDDPRKFVIDETSASIIRRMFSMAAQGHTGTQIARAFNDEGIPTPQQRQKALGGKRRWSSREDNSWSSSLITKLLQEERYTGKQIFGKVRAMELGKPTRKVMPRDQWVIIPGAIPAIISEEEYHTVREHVNGRYKGNHAKKSTALLFAKKIKCGKCGLAMRPIHRLNDVKYQCGNYNQTDKYGCTNDCIFEHDITAAVLSALKQQIALADNARQLFAARAESLAPSVEKLKAEIVRLQKQIEKSKTAKMGLWEKYHAGGITGEIFQRENEKADALVENNSAKIPEIQSRIRDLETEAGQENVFVERYAKQIGITELTRPVVEEFINEIRVFSPDRIEIIFNYADEYAKIAELINDKKTKRRAS